MDEVEALVRALLGAPAAARSAERLSYREAFLRELGLDPFSAGDAELARAAQPLGFRGDADTAARRPGSSCSWETASGRAWAATP